MSDLSQSIDTSLTYEVRFTARAQRDLDMATVYFAETASADVAIAWREGIYQAISSLSTFPRRCPHAPQKFRHEVRQLLYRRPGSKIFYRILFAITSEDISFGGVPTVYILHIRHASTRPITRKQARTIEEEL